MVKNDICLGGARKQNAPFLKKFAPKNASMPLMSRIGPGYTEIIGIKEVHLGKKRLHLNNEAIVLWQKLYYVTLKKKNDQFFELT